MTDGSAMSPTRSAFLELKDERRVVQEGYDFLDEKRILLAAEILRQLREYTRVHEDYLRLQARAVEALSKAIARHGIDGLTVYPTPELRGDQLHIGTESFLGVTLVTAEFSAQDADTVELPANPSPEARSCVSYFRGLVELAATLAAQSNNLSRLAHEYMRTERRARALENVLLPELDANLKFMDEQLEALDQEEAVRVRVAGR